MITAALIAGCSTSEAAPNQAPPPANPTVVAPSGWHADPGLAKAAAAAACDPNAAIAVTASEAWSEPARGCYALVLDLRGGAAPIDAAAEQLLAALGTELPGVKLHEIQKPAAGPRGTLVLGFDRADASGPQRGGGDLAPFHGRLRAELASTGEVHALACMWNQREPKVCEAACTRWLGGAP